LMNEGARVDADAVARRIAETAAWCAAPRRWSPLAHPYCEPPPAGCRFGEFRSPELIRGLQAHLVEASGEVSPLSDLELAGESGFFMTATPAVRAAIAGRVMDQRATLLGRDPMGGSDVLRGGRLLAVLPGWSLAEGACRMESQCFFDDEDTPPWDLWVGHERAGGVGRKPATDCLLSWVPPHRFEVVERGIHVSSTEAVLWASDVGGPVGRRLRRAGLA
jgi:hypothetical protein